LKHKYNTRTHSLKQNINKLELELKHNFKITFDHNNFINYIEDRVRTCSNQIVNNMKVERFTKHPFEVYNECKPIDYDRITSEFELLIGNYEILRRYNDEYKIENKKYLDQID